MWQKRTYLTTFYSSKFSRDMTVDMCHVQAKQFFAVRCEVLVISYEQSQTISYWVFNISNHLLLMATDLCIFGCS